MLSHKEERITLIDDNPIAIAATSGGKMACVMGKKRPAATGMEQMLYNNDHPKLALILSNA